jgi:hypothetical protein
MSVVSLSLWALSGCSACCMDGTFPCCTPPSIHAGGEDDDERELSLAYDWLDSTAMGGQVPAKSLAAMALHGWGWGWEECGLSISISCRAGAGSPVGICQRPDG